MTTTSLTRVLVAGLVAWSSAGGAAVAQGLTGRDLAFHAYQQALSRLTSALQASDVPAASDALITVLAINETLTLALETDRVRIRAVSRTVELGESRAMELVEDATLQRATQALFAGVWVATGSAHNRQLALDGADPARDSTAAAMAALAPLLTRIQGLPVPPAFVVNVETTRGAGGSFTLLVTVVNAGDRATEALTLTMRKGDTIGGGTEDVTLAALPPGASVRHVFAVTVPSAAQAATVQVEASTPNATTDVFYVDLNGQ
jgi:hypothetical protein